MRREKELRTRGVEDRREKETAKPHLLIMLPEVLKAFLYKVWSLNWIQIPGIGDCARGCLWETKSLFPKMKENLFLYEFFSFLNHLDSLSIRLPDHTVTMGKAGPTWPTVSHLSEDPAPLPRASGPIRQCGPQEPHTPRATLFPS